MINTINSLLIILKTEVHMKTSIVAVLHLASSKDSASIYVLGGRIFTAMFANQTIFPKPDPELEAFSDELKMLDSLMKAQDGSDRLIQSLANQSELVYASIKSLCFYVNKIAKGDKTIIGISGFDCKQEASEHPIPDKAIIKRIEDGSTEHSAKILVFVLDSADRYNVEITTTPIDSESWKLVLNAVSSKKLEITGLTRGQEIWFRVTGGNTHGWGPHGDAVAFVPQ